jgi:hypothetical protein
VIYYHDHSRPAPSTEHTRCALCQSIVYPVPILFDGVPVGRFAWRCPHCDDKRPLDAAVVRRIASLQAHAREEEAEREFRIALVARARKARAQREQSDPDARARCIAALQAWYQQHGRTPTYQEMGSTGPVYVPGLSSRAYTRRLFGTMRDMVIAAGLPARVSGRQVSEDGAPVPAAKGRGMVIRRVAG